MDVRHNDIEAFCREHFNEPVIVGLQVGRLIGFAETAIDCYYVVHDLRRGIVWQSAVGPCMTLRALKEQDKTIARTGEEWNNFTRLDEWLALNGAPKVETFQVTLKHDDHEVWGRDVGSEVTPPPEV